MIEKIFSKKSLIVITIVVGAFIAKDIFLGENNKNNTEKSTNGGFFQIDKNAEKEGVYGMSEKQSLWIKENSIDTAIILVGMSMILIVIWIVFHHYDLRHNIEKYKRLHEKFLENKDEILKNKEGKRRANYNCTMLDEYTIQYNIKSAIWKEILFMFVPSIVPYVKNLKEQEKNRIKDIYFIINMGIPLEDVKKQKTKKIIAPVIEDRFEIISIEGYKRRSIFEQKRRNQKKHMQTSKENTNRVIFIRYSDSEDEEEDDEESISDISSENGQDEAHVAL